MNFCPNLSNKKIKLEFDELISIFGEDGAYLIWDRSKGNGLELAPNGADSQLFKTLLEHYNGDRRKAIEAKAKLYSNNFLNWFGDWINDPENSSKVVDENGEPLVVYHSSSNYFSEFSHKKGSSNTGAKDSKELFFFMTDKKGSSWYSGDMYHNDIKHTPLDISGLKDELRSKLFPKWIPNIVKETYKWGSVNVDHGHYEDVLYEQKHSNYGDVAFKIFKNGVLMDDEGDIEYYKDSMFFNMLPIQLQDEILNDVSELKGIKYLLDLWYDVINYENAVRDAYDESAGVLLDFDHTARERVSRYFERPFFLNVRNIEDASDVKKENNRKTSLVKYIQHSEYDGFVVKDTIDSATQTSLADVYAVRNPNQIKSVDNEGGYSKLNNNVYKEGFSDLLYIGSTDERLYELLNDENGKLGVKREVKLRKLFDIIEQNSEISLIIDALHSKRKKESLLDGVTVILEDTSLNFGGNRNKYEGRRAFYDASEKTIHISASSNYKNGDSSNVIFHEIIHAITVDRILSNDKFREEIELIINDYCKETKSYRYSKTPFDDHHIEEFIADLWSNPELIEELKKIPSPRTGDRSMWEAIKKFLSKILKGAVPNSLFEEATDKVFKLLEEQPNKKSKDRFFYIGLKRKEVMRNQLSKHVGFKNNPSEIESTIYYIEQMGEISKVGGDPKVEKAALHWVLNDTLRFPSDILIFNQAIDIIKRKGLDYAKYKSPAEVIDKNQKSVKQKPINPDSMKEFTNKKVLSHGVTIYNVENDFNGLVATRKIVDTHWGEDVNPWCLITRRENSDEETALHISILNLSADLERVKKLQEVCSQIERGEKIDFAKYGFRNMEGVDKGWFINISTHGESYSLTYVTKLDAENYNRFHKKAGWTLNDDFASSPFNLLFDPFAEQVDTTVPISKLYSILRSFENKFNDDLNSARKELLKYEENKDGDKYGSQLNYASEMWQHYSGHTKQIAFKDGKLLAFNASEGYEDTWWDRMDQPSSNIPLGNGEFLNPHRDATSDADYQADERTRQQLDLFWFGLGVGEEEMSEEEMAEGHPEMTDEEYNMLAADIMSEEERVYYNINPTKSTIPTEYEKKLKHVKQVVEFLQLRFRGLTVNYITSDQIPAGINKNANSFVKDGAVYLIVDRVTSEIAIEEMLHPFIKGLLVSNYDLFDNLFEEAKQKLPKLWEKIQSIYSNEQGFSESDRMNELVTQSLSKYFLAEHTQNKPGKINNLITKFLSWLKNSICSFISQRDGINYVNSRELSGKLKLKDIAKMLNTTDTRFQYHNGDSIMYSLSDQELHEKLIGHMNTLYKTYERMPNKTVSQQKLLNRIYETYNNVKQLTAIETAREIVNFAQAELGVENGNTQTPQGYNPNDRRTFNKNMWSFLLSQESKDFAGISPELLVDMYKNYIGFYKNLLNTLDNINEEHTNAGKKQIRETISNVETLWKKAMVSVVTRVIDDYVDTEFSEYKDEEKENMKVVFKDWAFRNSFYGDISTIQSWTYNYGQSKNEIINMGFHIIQRADTKTLEESQHIAAQLTKAFLKANTTRRKFSSAWLTVYMETNRDGLYTGYFIRDINYGQYQEDLNNFVKELNDEFDRDYGHHYEHNSTTGEWINSETGLSVDIDDNEVWGDTGNDWNDMPTYFKYLDRIELWKDKHCNRRYKYEYYRERMSRPYNKSLIQNMLGGSSSDQGHGLSPRTLIKYNRIQSNINYYLDLCTDEEGFARPEKLDNIDKLKLDMWKQELDDLSNPFNHDGTPKDEDDQSMALEIRAWQSWINDKLNTSIFLEKFNEELAKVEKEAVKTGNYKLIDDFYRYNSRQGIHPDYIAQTIGKFSKPDENMAALHAKLLKSGLQGLVKSTGNIDEDLKLMEHIPLFWKSCKVIDEVLEAYGEESNDSYKAVFAENFLMKPVFYTDANGNYIDFLGRTVSPIDAKNDNYSLKTYHEYIIASYVANAKANGFIEGVTDTNGDNIDFSSYTDDELKAYFTEFFTYEHSYKDKNGLTVIEDKPLSIFQYMIPSKDKFLNKRTGMWEPTELKVPTGSQFSQKYDKNNQYINDEYDYTSGEAELPKRYDEFGNKLYDNTEAFNKIANDENTKKLYDIMIETMKESQQLYQTTNRRFNYKLPQINATNMALLSRTNLWGKGVWLKIAESIGTVQENDTGLRTEESFITDPDGTKSLSLPLRYVFDLKDPSTITTDIVSAVKLFANMSINYKNSANVEATLKSLQYAMEPSIRENNQAIDQNNILNSENSLKMYKAMMQKHFYQDEWNDKTVEDIDKQSSFSDKAKDLGLTTIQTALTGAFTGASVGSTTGLFSGGILAGAAVGAGLGLVAGAALGFSLWSVGHAMNNSVAKTKILKLIHRTSTLRTLGCNHLSYAVGFVDSITRILTESVLGKYMSVRDVIFSIFYNLWNLPKYVFNIGNPNPTNKMACLMRLNGLSKSFEDSHKRTSKGRIRNLSGNLLMGGHSMTDWYSNAVVLKAFYNQHRFYNGPDFPTGFYTEYEMRKMYQKQGYGRIVSKAKAWWTHLCCSKSLFGAYTYKDGEVTIKPEYEQYVTDKIKTRMRGKLLQRTALYNGVNPDNDTPRYKTTIIGAFVGSMRGWMTQQIEHLVAGGDSISIREFEEEKTTTIKNGVSTSDRRLVRKPLTAEQKAKAFKINHETGMPQDDILLNIISGTRALFAKICWAILTHHIITLGLGAAGFGLGVAFGGGFADFVNSGLGTNINESFLNASGHVLSTLSGLSTGTILSSGLHEKLTKGKSSKPKPRNLSETETYAFRDAFVYLAVLAAMLFTWPSLHREAQDSKKPLSYTTAKMYLGKELRANKEGLTTNKKLARQQSSAFFPWEQEYYDQKIYLKQADAIYFRVIESKMANTNPWTMMDVVKSLTALLNGFESNFTALGYIGDVSGLSGHDPDEVLVRGAYKNYERQERDFQKTIFPFRAFHTAFSHYGLIENERFYLNTYGQIYKAVGRGDILESPKKKEQEAKKSKTGPKKITGPGKISGPKKVSGPKKISGPKKVSGPKKF